MANQITPNSRVASPPDTGTAHLARLGRPVKKMIGGISGWVEEGFELVSESDT